LHLHCLLPGDHNTGSLFYVISIVCHFPPGLRDVFGLSVEMAKFILQASLEEVSNDKFNVLLTLNLDVSV
jgi:hypothetical protein